MAVHGASKRARHCVVIGTNDVDIAATLERNFFWVHQLQSINAPGEENLVGHCKQTVAAYADAPHPRGNSGLVSFSKDRGHHTHRRAVLALQEKRKSARRTNTRWHRKQRTCRAKVSPIFKRHDLATGTSDRSAGRCNNMYWRLTFKESLTVTDAHGATLTADVHLIANARHQTRFNAQLLRGDSRQSFRIRIVRDIKGDQ